MDNYSWRDPELKANIYYLTESEGGRKTSVYTGYRGQFFYDGRDWDAPQQFIDKQICELGDNVDVYLKTLSPFCHIGKFIPGKTFEIREGAKTVGKGIITEILRDDFKYWDYSTFYSSLPRQCSMIMDEDLNDFKLHLKQSLLVFNEIVGVDFTFNPNLPNSILIANCKLKNSKVGHRPLLDKICDQWNAGITLFNNLYKVNFNFENKVNFNFDFAIWDKYFLTGKIIL